MHVDQLTNSGGAFLAARLRAATADHLEQANAAEIAALAEAGVQPVLLPGSVYSLGKTRYPPAREMIEAGLAVVLASDFNPGSSPTASMPMVLSLAATQMKMTPAECVTAATINPAYSLNRGDEIGSLEPGKLANFVLYDCADYRELCYYFGVSQIALGLREGRTRPVAAPCLPRRSPAKAGANRGHGFRASVSDAFLVGTARCAVRNPLALLRRRAAPSPTLHIVRRAGNVAPLNESGSGK